jgi:hypothetical protein
VCCAGLNLNYVTSAGVGIHFIITLILSDVPTTTLAKDEYFDNLLREIIKILDLSRDWSINISSEVDFDPSMERRLGLRLSRKSQIRILLTSSSADPGDISALKSKLDSQAFIDQLNSVGFKASKASSASELNTSSNKEQSSFVVGLSSGASILAGLILLFCLVKHFYGRARKDSKSNDKSKTIHDDNLIDCNLFILEDIPRREGADGASAESPSMRTMAQYSLEGASCDTNQMNEADYSIEFEDVIQLIARLGISIKSLVDPLSRKEIEATIQKSNEIPTYDCTAALQLISKIELDCNAMLHTPDQKKMFHQKIKDGPLTENHLFVVKLLCYSEVHDTSMAVHKSKIPDRSGVDVANKQTNQGQLASHGESGNKKDIVSFDEPLLDVLLLLKKCDLEPSYLMQEESRKVIEDNLINRQRPLLKEHLAVLQLVSILEMGSDLSLDSMRKHLLEIRIKEGPLNANHFNAAQSLGRVEPGELDLLSKVSPAVIELSETRVQALIGQPHCVIDLDHQGKEYRIPDGSNLMRNLTLSSSHGTLTHESKLQDLIFGVEVKSTLLSRQEKAALQLMELREKTASIRQSLPDWVKNGLVPPKRNPSPLATVLQENLAKPADPDACKDAVQISCSVREDLGFLGDILPPTAQPRSQQEAPENLFLGVDSESVVPDQCVDIAVGEQHGWQASPLPGDAPGSMLSMKPPSRSLLARFVGSLVQCLSNCLAGVAGSCRSVLSFLRGKLGRM